MAFFRIRLNFTPDNYFVLTRTGQTTITNDVSSYFIGCYSCSKTMNDEAFDFSFEKSIV